MISQYWLIITYFMRFGNDSGQRAIINVDDVTNVDTLGKVLVRAGNHLVITLDCIVDTDFQLLSSFDFNCFVIPKQSRSDLWSLGIKHHSTLFVRSLF